MGGRNQPHPFFKAQSLESKYVSSRNSFYFQQNKKDTVDQDKIHKEQVCMEPLDNFEGLCCPVVQKQHYQYTLLMPEGFSVSWAYICSWGGVWWTYSPCRISYHNSTKSQCLKQLLANWGNSCLSFTSAPLILEDSPKLLTRKYLKKRCNAW